VEKKVKSVIIIGAGPAGLFSAYQLIKQGIQVALYDHQGGVGKKFLVAGHGGLNLTHSEDLETFTTRYGKDRERFEKYIHEFTPQDLRNWCQELGVETFIGTSGRVFPKKLKSAEILFLWLEKLKSSPLFTLHLKHKLIAIDFKKDLLTFQNQIQENVEVSGDHFILALGGSSWKKTGSDGQWVDQLIQQGIQCIPFEPMNCGFEKGWSPFFVKKMDRFPLKNIALHFKGLSLLGEMMITPYGVEGTSIYALSRELREEITRHKKALLHLDLKPEWEVEKVIQVLQNRKNQISLSHHITKGLKLQKGIYTLLKELLPENAFDDEKLLASHIKKLPLTLTGTRPLDEAISTSGGVSWSELTPDLQLKKFPKFFAIGEMLDFDAPTGGYLLQAAFSTAYWAAKKISNTSLKD
jgi:uncharacterized flavoprotein (TIGR03862 family)